MRLRPIGKKGDLSLSINAIVILILAITMLGLGLAFIRGQFGGVTKKLAGMTEQIDAGQKAELLASPEKITFRVDDFEIKKGTSAEEFFAVRNHLEKEELFDITTFACTDAIDLAVTADNLKTFITFETLKARKIKDGASFVFPLVINVQAGAISTVYSCALTIVHPDTDETEPYAVKEFFIKVVS